MDNILIMYRGDITDIRIGAIQSPDGEWINLDCEGLWFNWTMDASLLFGEDAYPMPVEIGYVNGNPYAEFL